MVGVGEGRTLRLATASAQPRACDGWLQHRSRRTIHSPAAEQMVTAGAAPLYGHGSSIFAAFFRARARCAVRRCRRRDIDLARPRLASAIISLMFSPAPKDGPSSSGVEVRASRALSRSVSCYLGIEMRIIARPVLVASWLAVGR